MIKLLFPISSKFCLLPIRHQWLGSQDFGNRPTVCSEQNTLSPYAEGVPAERNSAHIDNYLDKLMPMVKCWENSKTGPCHRTQHLRWACQRPLWGGDNWIQTSKASSSSGWRQATGIRLPNSLLFLLPGDWAPPGLGSPGCSFQGPHVRSAGAWAGKALAGPPISPGLWTPSRFSPRAVPPLVVQLMLIMLYAYTLLFAKDFTTWKIFLTSNHWWGSLLLYTHGVPTKEREQKH